MLPTLKTSRLTLRPFSSDDVANLTDYLGDVRVSRMLGPVPFPYTDKDAREWVTFNEEADLSDTINWALDDGTGLVGVIGAHGLAGSNSFGYWLGQPFWGKGYMSEAARVALAHIFNAYPTVDALRAHAFNDNPASQAVLQKVGFRPAGQSIETSRARPGAEIPSTRFELTRVQFLAEKLDTSDA